MNRSKISRRGLVCGAVFSTIALPFRAGADMRCNPVNPMNGVQECEVGLDGLAITARNASTVQQKQNWCWAACIQGIFAWHGCNIEQDQIVTKVFSDDMDAPATGEQIFSAISGFWDDASGRRFVGQANPLIDTNFSYANPEAASAISMELRDNFPLIVGTQGHATIVTAMNWINTPFGQRITNITVRDPWPTHARKRSLSNSEFVNINFLMQIRVFPA